MFPVHGYEYIRTRDTQTLGEFNKQIVTWLWSEITKKIEYSPFYSSSRDKQKFNKNRKNLKHNETHYKSYSNNPRV